MDSERSLVGGGRVPDIGESGGLIEGLDMVGEFVIAGLLLAEDLGDGSLVEGDEFEFIVSMLAVSSVVVLPIIIWAIEFDIVIW